MEPMVDEEQGWTRLTISVAESPGYAAYTWMLSGSVSVVSKGGAMMRVTINHAGDHDNGDAPSLQRHQYCTCVAVGCDGHPCCYEVDMKGKKQRQERD